MKVSDALAYFGGNRSALARKAGISQPAVSNWLVRKKTVVPELTARRLHQLTRGRLALDEADYARR
jgi:hypothetical protein